MLQPVEEELNEDLLFTPQTRAMSNGFEGLDEVSLGEVFEVRAQVMKTVPNVMKGVFRGGLKMSLEEILKGHAKSDSVKEIRGWKLFFLLPRLLLFRPPQDWCPRQGCKREDVHVQFRRVVDFVGNLVGSFRHENNSKMQKTSRQTAARAQTKIARSSGSEE